MRARPKREVATAVAWQVSTFALIGLALGVPLGAALTRPGVVLRSE